jgi:hypothetical protein
MSKDAKNRLTIIDSRERISALEELINIGETSDNYQSYSEKIHKYRKEPVGEVGFLWSEVQRLNLTLRSSDLQMESSNWGEFEINLAEKLNARGFESDYETNKLLDLWAEIGKKLADDFSYAVESSLGKYEEKPKKFKIEDYVKKENITPQWLNWMSGGVTESDLSLVKRSISVLGAYSNQDVEFPNNFNFKTDSIRDHEMISFDPFLVPKGELSKLARKMYEG